MSEEDAAEQLRLLVVSVVSGDRAFQDHGPTGQASARVAQFHGNGQGLFREQVPTQMQADLQGAEGDPAQSPGCQKKAEEQSAEDDQQIRLPQHGEGQGGPEREEIVDSFAAEGRVAASWCGSGN